MANFKTVFAVIFASTSLWACTPKGQSEDDHNHDVEVDIDADHDAEGGEDTHAEEIILEPSMAEKFSVATAVPQKGNFRESIKVSGQIVDSPNSASVVSAPTSGIVKFSPGIMASKEVSAGATIARISATGISGGDVNAMAKANYEAAKREYDRIKPLYDDKLVTARTYQDALQALEVAKAAYSPQAASGSAKALTSGVITELLAQEGQFVNAGEPLAAISSNTQLTLRADLPEKYYSRLPYLTSANIVLPYSSEVISLDALGGKKQSSNQAISASRGYVPVLFTFKNNGMVLPGTYVQAHLLGSSRDAVISIPLKALSEQQGKYFVYKRLDEEGYQKVPVTVGMNDGFNVEILSGLQGDEEIVVDGVIAVRLAETSGVVPEGHSHTH